MEFVPIFPQLKKDECRFLKIFLKKSWEWLIILILFFLFVSLDKWKLVIGGFLLLFIGIKKYLIEGFRRNKGSLILLGISVVYMGLVSLFAKIFFPINVDMFIFLIMIVFICISIAYTFLMRDLNKILNFLAGIFFMSVCVINVFTTKALLSFINTEGFSNPYSFWASIAFFIWSILIYFILIRLIFFVIKKIIDCPLFNNYFYFSLSIAFFILSNGYYYLENLSQDKLKDFLIILSIAFVTSFIGVSAIKNLEYNSNPTTP